MHSTFYLLSFLALTGCAITNNEPASEVYSHGSTIGGGYSELNLFDDGKWTQWFATCTSRSKLGHGIFEKKEDKLVLRSGSKVIKTLYLYPHNGATYLVDAATVEELKKDAGSFRPQTVLKRTN